MAGPSGPSRKEGLRCECGKLYMEWDPETGELGALCGRGDCHKFHPFSEINRLAAEFGKEKRREEMKKGKMKEVERHLVEDIEPGDVLEFRWGTATTIGVVKNNPEKEKHLLVEISPLCAYASDEVIERLEGAPYQRSFSTFNTHQERLDGDIIGIYKSPEEVYWALMRRFQETLEDLEQAMNHWSHTAITNAEA